MTARGWRSVRDEVRRRIQARDWRPGDDIPREVDLAAQLGCARSTVNRALRALAEEGLLERRRRAGTRVAPQPVAQGRLEIPLIRREVEGHGAAYGYRLLARDVGPCAPTGLLSLGGDRVLRVEALHLADGAPYALELRRIDLAAVPDAADADFAAVSPNEWLLARVPYSTGAFAIDATACDAATAERLRCPRGAPALRLRRLTGNEARALSSVAMLFPPGHAVMGQI
ncbi:MAG: GntR family transcriptional regulator [Paracoccaceae bacterium]